MPSNPLVKTRPPAATGAVGVGIIFVSGLYCQRISQVSAIAAVEVAEQALSARKVGQSADDMEKSATCLGFETSVSSRSAVLAVVAKSKSPPRRAKTSDTIQSKLTVANGWPKVEQTVGDGYAVMARWTHRRYPECTAAVYV